MQSAEIKVNDRKGLIKICHLLAKGMSHPIGDSQLNIDILGKLNSRKSLVVDAMINALNDKDKKYLVPIADKMRFETTPGSAIDFPACAAISVGGVETYIRFVRRKEDIPCMRIGMPGINFYSPPGSDAPSSGRAHMRINVERLNESDGFAKLSIIVEDTILNEKMREVLEHIDKINTRTVTKSPRAMKP